MRRYFRSSYKASSTSSCPHPASRTWRVFAATLSALPSRAGAAATQVLRFLAAAAHCCPRPAAAVKTTAAELRALGGDVGARGPLAGGRLRALQLRFQFRGLPLHSPLPRTSYRPQNEEPRLCVVEW
ncbi:uncharacterized protein LOC144340292 [Macaca mulatta]